MLEPAVLNPRGVQQMLVAKTRLGKEVRRPRTKRPPQPGADRYVESLFRAIEEVAWQGAAEDLPQEPFALAMAHLRAVRQCPAELDNPMVEDRTTCLQAGRHTGAIEFHQNIARQILEHVAEDKDGKKISERGPPYS